MAKLKIGKELFNWFYPIGSYYETSDPNFNPASAGWFGTWVEDTAGRVTVALDTTQSEFCLINLIGGSKYLQNHTHNYLRHHFWFGERNDFPDIIGIRNQANGDGIEVPTTDVKDVTTGNSGNLQPYVVVKRWHRTA